MEAQLPIDNAERRHSSRHFWGPSSSFSCGGLLFVGTREGTTSVIPGGGAIHARSCARSSLASISICPAQRRLARLAHRSHADEVRVEEQPRQGTGLPPGAALDPYVPSQWRHPAVGLLHGDASGEVRRARRTCPRRGLPQLAAAHRVRRRRLQDQGVGLQAAALSLHAARALGLHPHRAVPQ
eukprot:scaffold870_cov268-Pinguiococcus_pyrenoidosus.AAC.79